MGMRESIKNITNLLINVHDADLKAQLQTAVLDAQGEALNLQERLAKLQEENAELRKRAESSDRASELENDLYFARNGMWRKSETALSAYCTTCWATKQQLIRLKPGYQQDGGFCQGCEYVHDGVYANDTRPEPE